MATQPGWYDDGSGQQRYWDGSQWTEHVAGASPAASGPVAGPGGTGAPKKRRVGMWIGIGIGAVVLLCGGGIAILVAFVLNVTAGPKDAVNGIFDALEKGDCPALYSHLHDDMTSGLSEAEYCAGEPLSPTDISYSIPSVSVENSQATVRVKVSPSGDIDGMSGEWDYILQKEDGEWLLRSVRAVG